MGKPAARITDAHACPIHGRNSITAGSPDVFTNKLNSARVTDGEACGSAIVAGSAGVFINGLPAARLTDPTNHGGAIASGSPDVFIGEIGSAGSSSVSIRKGKKNSPNAGAAAPASASASPNTSAAAPASAASEAAEYTPGEEAWKVATDIGTSIRDGFFTGLAALPMVGDDASRTQAREDIWQDTKDMAQGFSDLAGPSIIDVAKSAYGVVTGDPEKAAAISDQWDRTKEVYSNIADSAVDGWNEAVQRNGIPGGIEKSVAVIIPELLTTKGVGPAIKAGKLGSKVPDAPDHDDLSTMTSEAELRTIREEGIASNNLTRRLSDDASEIISNSTKGQLRRQAALSNASIDELDIVSGNFTNLPGSVKNFPGVNQINDDVFSIEDQTAYINQVEKLYADSGSPLNAVTRSRILDHIGDKSMQFPTQAGIPGLHAEVQSVNNVINQAPLGFDLSKISVSTIKLYPGSGQGLPFPACTNCGGILSNHVNILTGVK
ncbi:YwqJ-related putative deaminase [Marinomonas gallaica]|uniref:YwqJ-related putative deaminase n=1 Tax=Marinomonas gallaica TaxID=1806667 RepID=UPI003CE4C7D4